MSNIDIDIMQKLFSKLSPEDKQNLVMEFLKSVDIVEIIEVTKDLIDSGFFEKLELNNEEEIVNFIKSINPNNQNEEIKIKELLKSMSIPNSNPSLEDYEEKIKVHGFVTHLLIEDDGQSPTGYNIHTHGMEQFNHLDFQIVIPMDEQGHAAHSIFHTLVNKVKDGKKFFAGERYSDIIQNYDITFVLVTENEREVLRVILPDPEGNLALEDIHEKFAIQYSQGIQIH